MIYTNIFYQRCFNIIGGVETFLYELAKLSNINKRDLTILYRTCPAEQLEKIQKYCRIICVDDIKFPIKCKRAFFNWNVDIIDLIEAEEYIQIIHADFTSSSLNAWIGNIKSAYTNPRITKQYAVSINSAKSFEKVIKRKVDVLYNPIVVEPSKKIMTLISAQRLTNEKGGKRLEKMIRALDGMHIPYVWHIFSNDTLSINSPNVMYHKPCMSVRDWIKYADYTVLLSDTEGFPYTAYESLCLNTPLIITKLPILDDLGVNENNSIVLDFDMKNLNVTEIYEKCGNFKFEYKKKPDGWLQLLEGESTYVYTEPKLVKVKALINFTDIKLKRDIKKGEVYSVPEKRAEYLVQRHGVEYYKE